MDGKRVLVHRNVAGAEGKVFMVKGGDMGKLRKLAAKKLGMKSRPKRVFLPTGVEISNVEEIRTDDHLYISAGEPFYKDAGAASARDALHVSVLGGGAVGKSALTLRFVRGFFVEEWDPTIEDAYRKPLDLDDSLCMLEILDTAGQDDFEALRPQWMMDKAGYIFVFAVDEAESLDRLQPFFDLHQQINEGRDPQPPIVIVANKKDLADEDPARRLISEARGREVAAQYGASYVEASALTGENVDLIFETFVREVRRRRHAQEPASSWWPCSVL